MANDMTIRWKWIKGMYIYTIIGAGGYVIIFASYIIGDLIAIPFPYLFAKATSD